MTINEPQTSELEKELAFKSEELNKRTKELAVINSIQEGLAKKMDITSIYQMIGEKVREIFNAQVIDIVTYDPQKNLIEDQYAYEKGDTTLLEPRNPQGFRKHVIESRQLLVINEDTHERMEEFDNKVLVGEEPKSLVFVPLITGGEVKAIISLQDLDKEHAFSDADISLLNTIANSMGLALENARLFDETSRLLKETEQRNAELAVINSVQDGLARELDIKGIYELVGEKMREIFNAQVIDIMTYDKNTDMIEDRYTYEKGDRTLLGPRPLKGFRKHVIESGKPLVINKDVAKLRSDYDNTVLIGEPSKSIVLVPMTASGEITGVISLQNLDQENAFPESDVNLLTTLANSMSVALESARLFDKTNLLLKETEQRTAELAVINSVQEGLAKEMDIQAIYELVGEKMREIFNAQVIDIVTYDPQKNLIEDQYSYEKGDRTMLGPRQPSGFRNHVIRTGKVLVHNENVERAMREFGNEVLIGETPKSLVYAPMIAGEQVKGVISLQNLDQEHAFSEGDISLLSTLVNSMTVALQNARLFDETSRLLKETEQRTAELAVINSVQEGLARELDIQSIYDLVGDRIRDLFNAQAVVIATLDIDKGMENFKYVIENGTRFQSEPRPLDKLRQHLIRTRQKIVINKNFEEAFANFGMKVMPGTELPQSAVYVPLIIGDKITSYVSLQNVDHENAFSEADVRLLETLANSMSVALENARLFDETNRLLKETEQRTAELAVINSVQEGLAHELDMQAIYDLVGERIRDIFDAQAVIIANLDLDAKIEIFKYTLENGEKFNLEPRPFDKLRKHLVQTKQKVVINNAGEAFVWFGNKVLPGTKPMQSGAFVPLVIGEKITSYISLQNLDKENAFNDSDIRLLETLANSMSVALENARLFDETNRLLKETEQRTAELAVINSVQEGLARELDIQAIYNLVGDRLCDLFPDTQTLVIRTFDHATKLEHFQYAIEKGVKMEVSERPFIWANQLLIKTQQSLLINENYTEISMKYGGTGVTKGQPPKSAVFVPMIVGDVVKGSISLQNVDKENAFSESDLRLLTTLTNSMSVALENARLFDETTHLLKETEQRTAELAVINSVQDGLARELDISAIYQLVGDRLCDLFPDSQTLIIRTFDHNTGMEHFQYSIEKGERIHVPSKPFNWANKLLIKTKQSLLINENYVETSTKYGSTGIAFGEPPKSAVFVPMMVGDVAKGSISLQNIDRENAFSDSDLRLLTTLSNSMSVALENARLFDETTHLLKETEQRTAELAVINSVQEGLARELDMQAIYDMVGTKIRDVFNAQTVIIANLDHDTQMEHFKYYIEKDERSYPQSRLFDKLRQQMVETRQKIVINEKFAEAYTAFGLKVIPGTEMPESAVFVPLIKGDKVTSYVSLQNVDRENAFSESDIRLLETLANSMSVALENARLFDETNRLLKETEQRTAELAVINSVQDGLVREMDINAIYELVGERLCNLFNTQTVLIRTFDLEAGLEHWRYVIEKGERHYSDPRPLIWANKHLVEFRKPIIINENYLETSKKYGGSGVSMGLPPKSGVFVPMIVGDVVRGSVSLQNVEIENAFSDSDMRLLTTITNSMSVALENARLFDETTHLLKETEQHKAELAVINSVQEGLVREMDMKAIYDLVGNRICDLFDTQTVLIRTFDHKTGNEEWQFVIEKGQRYYSKPRPFNWANQLLIKTRQPLMINENYAETAQKHGGSGVTKGLPPKSGLFVPMVVGDVVRGSVSLQNVEKENAFSEADLRLLTTLTNSMSVALENARLFDETTHLLAQAKQRASELTTVNSISKALASLLDPEELIKLVGDQLRDLFKANIVYLALLDQQTNTISFPYQFGDNMEPMKLGEGLTSKIILTGHPLLFNKDISEMREQLGVQAIGIPAASYLGVPIPIGDEIIGVLSVQSTEQENRFDESDQRLLSTIAASVGVALRNAKLFEEVQQSKMEAEAASKVAEKANEAKSAFLSTVSHELRTPLTSVLGFAKIIRKRLDEKIFPIVDKSDPKTNKTIGQINENLQVVISEGERLTHLINDVLDLAKIEAGKMEWNLENVSLPEVAERAIAATTSLFDQKPIELKRDIQKDLPVISGDPDKLIQVMINLISNSVKFTDKGTVTCRLYQKDDEIIASISDTGIGIAPEDHAAVFEQFKQVGGDTLTDKPKGTGLGLPICKEIIEHHGGRIWLESEVGKGSVFSFALPVIKSEVVKAKPIHLDELVKQLKEQMVFSQLRIDGLASSTILVVDDDDSIRSLLQQELSDAGYLIDEASNGKEALERIRKNKPDLIILDVMMPEMNGFDVAAILKNDPQTMDIPIIVLSIVQDKARGFRIGVDRYLTKPIDTTQLFAEVGTLLEQGKSKRKVMIVDEDNAAVKTLTDVLQTRGYQVVESDGKELVERAIATQPDIIILNSVLSAKQEIVQTLRFEKGLENVLFFIYQ